MKFNFTRITSLFVLALAIIITGCDTGSGPDPDPLSVESFTPSSAEAGEQITITGTGFSPTASKNTVMFSGDIQAEVSSASDNALTVEVPEGAQDGPVTVTIGEESSSSGTDFNFLSAEETTPLAIDSIEPSSGMVGDTVVVSGTGFSGTASENTVTFSNGVDAEITTASATELSVVVPDGAENGPVTVEVGGKSTSTSGNFTVEEEPTTITIDGNVTSDATWEDGKTYILAGRTIVEPGVTLTIEGGAIIKGQAGTGASASVLLVARDATLNANGTAEAPIIFTSIGDEITPEMVNNGEFGSPNLDSSVQGLWGGVIVLGNAPISVGSGSEAQIEGIPSSETLALYGGDNPDDSSGSITYITIRHGGANIGEGNEINGLSLGGVGSGTTIENVEVVANQDDGVEWFGGTVNVTNVLVWNNGDDALDTDQAWSGTVDNVVTVTPSGSLMELDGPEGSFTSSGHIITNFTGYAGSETLFLADTDANTDVNISNALFLGPGIGLADGSPVTPLDDNYAEYAANTIGYAFTSLEVVLSSGAVADFFPQSLIDDGEVSVVPDYASATVGADASVFSWTWASKSGALADIGLE